LSSNHSHSQYPELSLLLQHHLFPLLLKTLSGRSAFPPALCNTELDTEAKVILTLIKLIGGETDACEPRLAWAPEGLMMEIMRR
jgi:hypothetical protein